MSAPHPRISTGRGGAADAKVLLFGVIIVSALAVAEGSLPAVAHIDSGSVAALIAGQAVCGDPSHADVCLYPVDCVDVDEALSCTEEDPVWISDGMTTGEALRRRAAFHSILFGAPDHGSHPNAKSLGTSVHKLVSTPTFWKLPRAAALYERREGAAPDQHHCGRRYCAIPAMLYQAYDDSVPAEKDIAFPSSKKPRPARLQVLRTRRFGDEFFALSERRAKRRSLVLSQVRSTH